MNLPPLRIIAIYCLTAYMFGSCGSTDDADDTRSNDTAIETAADSQSNEVITAEIEYIRGAHILINSGTASEDGTENIGGDALQRIQNIHRDILSGQATFEEMAFNQSDCSSAEDSGRLPAFTPGGITEELDSAFNALEPGEISGIITTRFGYHLLKRSGS